MSKVTQNLQDNNNISQDELQYLEDKAKQAQESEDEIEADNMAYYQEILDDPSNEKLATIVINLLEYMQGSTQAYLTNQATCLALVDVLQKKHIFLPEEFYESLKIQTEAVSKGFQEALKESIDKEGLSKPE